MCIIMGDFYFSQISVKFYHRKKAMECLQVYLLLPSAKVEPRIYETQILIQHKHFTDLKLFYQRVQLSFLGHFIDEVIPVFKQPSKCGN